MNDELSRILISDILNDIPNVPDVEFTPYYLSKRKRNIKGYTIKGRRLRRVIKVTAVSAALLLLVTGFYRISFMNGFAIGKDRTFIQLTANINEKAPSVIEKKAVLRVYEMYSLITAEDNESMYRVEYCRGDTRCYLNQFTVDAYNSYMENIYTAEIEYSAFSSRDKSGVYYHSGSRYIVSFIYGGYVFVVSCNGTFNETTDFINAISLED